MPQSWPTDNVFETLYQKIKMLEDRIKELEENPVPTIPIYDWDFPPDDPVEGQHAIFINAPAGTPVDPTDPAEIDPGANGFWKTVAGVLRE